MKSKRKGGIMKISKQWPQRLAGILIIALACQMILMGAVVAQDDTEQRRRPTASPDDVRTKSINLRIIGKTPEMIQTQYMNFLVTEATEVVDSKGNVMELAKMPVPCTARIDYEPGRLNNPVVWRIVYKGLLSGAKTAWSDPIKQ
jgi:hypothetical protein